MVVLTGCVAFCLMIQQLMHTPYLVDNNKLLIISVSVHACTTAGPTTQFTSEESVRSPLVPETGETTMVMYCLVIPVNAVTYSIP